MGHPTRVQVLALKQARRVELEQAKKNTATKKDEWRAVVDEVRTVERIAEERLGWRKEKG